jgi:hypothetical protein
MPRTGHLTEAQAAALRRLVKDGTLSDAQAEAVQAALNEPVPRARAARLGWLVEVAGYLGGALILAAATLFLSASWDALDRGARAWLLAGFAGALVVAGIVVAGGPVAVRGLGDGHAPARRRVVGLLFALACVPAGFAVGVALHGHAAALASVVALLVALAGLLVLPTVPGVVATVATSWNAVMAVSNDGNFPPLTICVLSLALGGLWCALGLSGRVGPRPLVVAAGLGIALAGTQGLLASDGTRVWAYGLTFAVALACFTLYRWVHEVVLLVGGILGATIAVPEAVSDLTNGALSGSVILLIAGGVLVTVSAVGLRLRRTGGAG